MKDWIGSVMIRELRALRRELDAYPNDGDLWRVAPGTVNPGGNLILHLTGNIQYFVGAVLGGTGYVRNRDAEFGDRGAPRSRLLTEIDRAIQAVETGLGALSDADLERPYPESVGGVSFTTGAFLAHLATHLAYHLGQVDYHRRIVTGDGKTVRAVPVTEIAGAEARK